MKRARGLRGPFSKTLWKAAAALIILSLLVPVIMDAGIAGATARPPVTPYTFSAPVMINDNKANVQANPVIAPMPGGDIFVAWRDARSGDDDIYTSSSHDNAVSFTANKRADDALTSSKQTEPATAVGADGTIYVTWQDNRRVTFDFDIFFTKSTDGGTTFAKNVRVDDAGTSTISWQERPSIAVTANGTVYVAWTDDRTGVVRVRGAYSTDGGATFSASYEISPNGGLSAQTGVALASDGQRIYAAFMDNYSGSHHAYLFVSEDGGRTFGNPIQLDGASSPGAYQSDISISALPRGGVVAAWEDSRNGNLDIYASIVRADGTVVVQDLRVDDDTTGAYQTDPCVAVDRAGTIYAVWEDERNLKYAIRFAHLKVGSAKFTSSTEVATPRSDDFQRKATVVCPEPGSVYVVWQDDRAGSYDVYASAGYFPNLFDLSLVKGWNFVCVPLVGWGYKASTLGLKTGDAVIGWNPATQSYDRNYIVGVSPSTADFTINPSEGYWVYATGPETASLNGMVPNTTQTRTISLPSGGGCAIIGFQSLRTDMRASDVVSMYSDPDAVVMVAGLDAATGTYKSYYRGVPGTDFALAPGQAYWIWCTASGVLSYTP